MFSLLIIFLAFSLTIIFGYCFHWIFHQKWAGPIYDAHFVHHQKLYPETDFLSDTYRDAGKSDTGKYFIIAFAPLMLLLVLGVVFGFLSIWHGALFLGTMLFTGWIHEYIHSQTHLTSSWMKILPFFNRWQQLHYFHHTNQDRNLSIFVFLMDRVCRTFKSE